MTVEVHLERGEAQGDPVSETIGPFEYVQITYEGLHCWSEGELDESAVFYIDGGSGMWYPEKREPQPAPSQWVSCGPDLSHHGWTDLTIVPVKG